MKITKVDGLGRFGCIVEDMNYDSIEDWERLKQINLETLVTVVRGGGKDRFNELARNAPLIGRNRRSHETILTKKYGADPYGSIDKWDEVDKMALKANIRWAKHQPLPENWHIVSGETDSEGKSLGAFGNVECLWHSNESGCYDCTPLVILYGSKGMLGSSTGFCTSTDWYEKQSNSFRSELDQLIAHHAYKPYSVAPGADSDHEAVLRRNFYMDDGADMPLVIKSPGGIVGLHFTYSSVQSFVGMSKNESDALIKKLVDELYIPEYTYDAWWENDTGDFIMFDNTITTHNRTLRPGLPLAETLAQRVAHRSHMDYRGLTDYEPFFQQEYNNKRKEYTNSMNYVSDLVDRHREKRYILSLDQESSTEYCKRFSGQVLSDIMNTDITQEPNLARFVVKK
jgi:hypothetical protein